MNERTGDRGVENLREWLGLVHRVSGKEKSININLSTDIRGVRNRKTWSHIKFQLRRVRERKTSNHTRWTEITDRWLRDRYTQIERIKQYDSSRIFSNMLVNIILFHTKQVWKMTHPLQKRHRSSTSCLLGVNNRPQSIFGRHQSLSSAQSISRTES